MPAQVARIMMSVLILVLGAFLYPSFLVVQSRVLPYPLTWSNHRLWIAGLLSWIAVRYGWFLVWRKQVVRTARRRRYSFAITLATPALSLLLWLIFLQLLDAGTELSIVLSTSIASIISLMGTVLSYAQTPADRAALTLLAKIADVHCPDCDYNLAGLTSTRCPECGKEYPLDALLAAQAQPAGQDV